MRIPKRVAIVGVVSVALVAMVVAAFVALTNGGAHAAAGGPTPIDDSQLSARFKVEDGATVLPTTRTVPHWFGQTTDPHNGVTYGYNMVGADPNHCGAACDVTIEVDITPIIVHVAGATYSGNDVLTATLNSPQFATNDYGSTPFATNTSGGKGAGGLLSQNDAGVQLQLRTPRCGRSSTRQAPARTMCACTRTSSQR